MVIPFKHLDLFPPNYNFTPVFEFTPMGFGYYVRIIPITYFATDIFFSFMWTKICHGILRLKLEKHCRENRPDDTKLWIERCEEGEKIMRMPLYMRAYFEYMR